MRLILIDDETGWIYGDSAKAGNRGIVWNSSDMSDRAIQLAAHIDEELGTADAYYEFHRDASLLELPESRQGVRTYTVWGADAHTLQPPYRCGDQMIVERVKECGTYLGIVEAIDIDEDEGEAA